MLGRHAVEVVDKAACDAETGIKGKESRESFGLLRIDSFPSAGQPPGPAKSFRCLGWSAHRFRRCMVKEAAKGFAAVFVVSPRKQDELVPGIVRRLRGHGYHAPSSLVANRKIIEQCGKNLGPLRFTQLGSFGGQTLIEEASVRKGIYKDRTALAAPVAPQHDSEQQQDGDEDDFDHTDRQRRNKRTLPEMAE